MTLTICVKDNDSNRQCIGYSLLIFSQMIKVLQRVTIVINWTSFNRDPSKGQVKVILISTVNMLEIVADSENIIIIITIK